MNKTGGQLLKYLVSGGATVAFYVGCVWLFTRTTDFPELWINSFFYALATVLSYTVNYFWAFQAKGKHGSTFAKYTAVALLGFGLNALFVAFMTQTLNLRVSLAALLFVMLWPFVSFTAQKFFVYKR